MARLSLCLWSILIILLLPFPVSAARKLFITANTTAIHGDEELLVTASASGFTNGEHLYMKGAFFKPGSTNYFGFTKNGDSWIKNSTKTKDQRQIIIGSWNGELNVKSDFADSGFSGNGEYGLKIGFYTVTADGDPSSVDWSDNIWKVSIEPPPATATPTPTTLPTATVMPTIRPSATPTIVIPSLFPSSTVILLQASSIPDPTAEDEEILSAVQELAPSDTIATVPLRMESKPGFGNTYLALGLLLIGVGLSSISIALFSFSYRRKKMI